MYTMVEMPSGDIWRMFPPNSQAAYPLRRRCIRFKFSYTIIFSVDDFALEVQLAGTDQFTI